MDWHPAVLERGTRLELLNLHYMEYLAGLAPEAAATLVLDWIERNPPFRDGYWKDDWNAYALSIRVVVWMDLLSADALPVDASLRPRVLQSLAAQLRFLTRNLETDIGGNHLIKNIRALLRGGRFFEGSEADAWLSLGARLLGREVREQVLPDGMHFELSPAYHLQVMGDLLDARRALAAGVASGAATHAATLASLDEALGRMLLAARLLTHPDGMPSLFADGALHMTHALDELVDAWRQSGPRIDPSPPASGTWSLTSAGYYGLRHGDDLLVVDCGEVGARHLPAHGHGDALAFEWTLGGVRVVVDAGVAEYHAGPLRAYSRSTKAHNTLTLDDADQSEFWAAFRVARRARPEVVHWGGDARSELSLTGRHDGYRRLAGAPRHERSIEAGRGSVRILDRVTGGRGQEAVARLLLGPGVTARVEGVPIAGGHGTTVVLSVPAGRHGPRTVRLTTSGDMRVESGIWMPDFGQQVAVQRIVVRLGRAPCEGTLVLTTDERDGPVPDGR
jgi:uncharacterized heparinase superfamily protein